MLKRDGNRNIYKESSIVIKSYSLYYMNLYKRMNLSQHEKLVKKVNRMKREKEKEYLEKLPYL